MSWRMLMLVAGSAILGAGAVAAAAADDTELSPAQKAVFESDQLHGLQPSTAIRYSYVEDGSQAGHLEDQASITVQKQAEDGTKTVVADFLSGSRKMSFPPFEMKVGNPIIMAFLERDVAEMSRLTGGSTLFFRSRIRDGFASADRAHVTPVTVTFEGHSVPGREVRVEPYVHAPLIERFAQYEHKAYVFVLADAVPGGVQSIRAETPGPADGQPLSVELLQYQGAEQAPVQTGATQSGTTQTGAKP